MKLHARSRNPQYNRAGIKLHNQWEEYDVTEEQLAALKGDPIVELEYVEEVKPEVVVEEDKATVVEKTVEKVLKKRGRKAKKK